ncbi:MAG TPA: STAS domain-containing protein [Candidatus Elarobacter sp.]
MSGGSVQVIRLAGELDATRREEIARALTLDLGRGGVLVDLSGAEYADSTVIAELVRLRRDADHVGRSVALLTGSPRIARILAYAGLGEAFRIFEDRGTALTALTTGTV